MRFMASPSSLIFFDTARADQAALATVFKLAGQVHDVAAIARSLVKTDRRIDLAGLADMVGLLCARALDLPPAQGRRAVSRLQRLLRELDALHAAIGLAELPCTSLPEHALRA